MIYWYLWWFAAFIILIGSGVASVILGRFKFKFKRLFSPNNLLFAGAFLSGAVIIYPLYRNFFPDPAGWLVRFKAFFMSIQHSLRLFAIDGDYMDLAEKFESLPSMVQMFYSGLIAFLCLYAPILTFGFILSFFKNISAYERYVLSYFRHTHVFSELNERSLALAKSLVKEDEQNRHMKYIPEIQIVFTDVLDADDEAGIELIEQATEIGAILFRRDLETIRYRLSFTKRKLSFYVISDDGKENIRHASHIMQEYDFDGVELRVVSDDIRTELMLASKHTDKIRVFRINDVQSLIYHELDVGGIRLFRNARLNETGDRVISAVIVGLGKYGKEMVKTLSWFCQVDGYRLKINVFDIREDAYENFAGECSELMDDAVNGRYSETDESYEIIIHSGVDVTARSFEEKLSEITDLTYVFVCLGDDDTNLKQSIRIRKLCERMKFPENEEKPDIETVIFDSDMAEMMSVRRDRIGEIVKEGVTNFKNQPYNIRMIGDIDSFYSVDALIASDLISAGLRVHMHHGEEADFWKYEYNYRSSIAKALAERLRDKAGFDVPGINKPAEKRTEEERLVMARLERKRWNAYMRSEGYRYSGDRSEESRNDLGKLHNDLLPVSEITDDDLKGDFQ